MRRRLEVLALAMLAAAASGASEPVLPPGVVEVDPGDPQCVTDSAVPRCSLRAAVDAVTAAGGGVIRLTQGSVHALSEVAAVNGLEGGSGLPSVTRCRIVRNHSEGRAGGVSALGPVEASDTTITENSAPFDPDYEGDFKNREQGGLGQR